MKRVVILILTLAFLAILYYAYTTAADGFVDVKKEGFTSAAPTRASDCNCLPGYIPSKEGGKYGGNIFRYQVPHGYIYLYNPSGTYDIYLMNTNNNNTCGLPTSGDFPIILDKDFKGSHLSSFDAKYRYTGWLRCDVVKKNTNTEETFFCQRLGDPSARRECY